MEEEEEECRLGKIESDGGGQVGESGVCWRRSAGWGRWSLMVVENVAVVLEQWC